MDTIMNRNNLSKWFGFELDDDEYCALLASAMTQGNLDFEKNLSKLLMQDHAIEIMRNGEYGSQWLIIAIAHLLGINVQIIYPVQSPPRYMNCLLRLNENSDDKIILSWTTAGR